MRPITLIPADLPTRDVYDANAAAFYEPRAAFFSAKTCSHAEKSRALTPRDLTERSKVSRKSRGGGR